MSLATAGSDKIVAHHLSCSVSSQRLQPSGAYQKEQQDEIDLTLSELAFHLNDLSELDSFSLTGRKVGAEGALSSSADSNTAPDYTLLQKLILCSSNCKKTISPADHVDDLRLHTIQQLIKYYKGNMSDEQLRNHSLGLMIYWWLQNRADIDLKTEVEFDCRGKLIFYKNSHGEQCVLIEVGEIKTLVSGLQKVRCQNIKRLLLLSGAVRSVYNVSLNNLSLSGKIFVARDLKPAYKRKQTTQANEQDIKIEYVDKILSLMT